MSFVSDSAGGDPAAAWPELPYEAWSDTSATLHMYLQVIGKVRLAVTPFEPQWANVPLYVTARGLTTSPMRWGTTIFGIDVDFVDHEVRVEATSGDRQRIRLEGQPVAEFYRQMMGALASLGVDVPITRTPSEVPDPIPFPEDTVHATYDPEWAQRFWRVLSQVDQVMKDHRARFAGRTTPVHFFWGTFDLALTRFSGRQATPIDAGQIERWSTNAELICAGFWSGNESTRRASFFAYGYPTPAGIADAVIGPGPAAWDDGAGEFLLPYDDVQVAADPRAALLEFLETTYAACAERMGWDPALARADQP